MAVVSGTVHGVQTLKSDSVQALQVAEVLFTVSGTYAQGDNGILSGVPTLIQNSRRNGKTVTMRGVTVGQTASKSSDPSAFMSLKTVAISSSDVTFEITDASHTTELADATAVPAQARPFSILVAFTEA
jgi:hypothetical protein